MPPKKKDNQKTRVKPKTEYQKAAENLTRVANQTTRMTAKDKKELKEALRQLWRATR